MCDEWYVTIQTCFLLDSVSMSKRGTEHFEYGEAKGFLVAFHNQTQMAAICTL